MRKRETTEEAQLTGSEAIAFVSLLALLFIFAISLMYPAGAFPLHGAMALAACVLLLWLALINVARGGRRVPPGPLVAVAVWFVLWMVAFLRAPSVACARPEFMTVLAGVAAYVIAFCGVACYPSRASIAAASLVVNALIVIIGFSALFGVYQVIGPAGWPRTFGSMERDILETMAANDPLRDGLLHALREKRAAGTVGAPNIFASLCLFALPLALGAAFASRRMSHRIACVVVAFIVGAAVFASKSSGGVLASAFAVTLLLLALAGWRLQPRTLIRAVVATAVILVVGLAALLAAILLIPAANVRWFAAGSMLQRFYYWQTAWEIWRPHFAFGAGPGAFELFYPQHRIPGSNETKHAHSWFFEYGASVGAAGIAVFFAIVAHAMKSAWRLLGRLHDGKDFPAYARIAAVAAAALAMLAHGLIDYTFFFRETAVLFFLALGALEGFALNGAASNAPSRRGASIACVAGMAALASFWLFRAEFIPARASLLREGGSAAIAEGDLPQALSDADKAVLIDGSDERNWELRAFVREQLGRPDALPDWQRALALNPHSARLHEALARYHARRGNLTRAIELQRQAISLHPLDANHQFTLAEFYLQAGDAKRARETFDATAKLLLPTKEETRRRESLGKQIEAMENK